MLPYIVSCVYHVIAGCDIFFFFLCYDVVVTWVHVSILKKVSIYLLMPYLYIEREPRYIELMSRGFNGYKYSHCNISDATFFIILVFGA